MRADSFADMQSVLIEPRRAKGESPVSRMILMSYTPRELSLIRDALGLGGPFDRRLDFAKLWSCPAPWEGVSLVGPALGAPAAVILLERLIALGARCVVGMGSCGSLQPDLNIGRVILPTGSIAEEGTSPHYQDPQARAVPDGPLLQALREGLQAEGIGPMEGRAWTTDAPFRETREKVVRYREQQVLAVDMETSALLAVASFRGLPFANLLVVSDELGILRWKTGFDDPRYVGALQRAAKVTARVLAERREVDGGHGEDR